MQDCRPTRHASVPKPAESAGSCTIVMPIDKLCRPFPARFAGDVVRRLYPRRPGTDLPDALADANLGPGALSLAEFFAGQGPPLPEGPAALAVFAEDLADDDGSWADTVAAELGELATQATEELTIRIDRLLHEVAARGPSGLTHALDVLREGLQARQDAVEGEGSPWTSERAAELRRCAQDLRVLGRPRGWLPRVHSALFRQLARWCPLIPSRTVTISPRIKRAITCAAEDRYRLAARKHRRRVYGHFLGEPGRPGYLDTRQQQARHQVQCLRALEEAFATPQPPEAATPERILLVTHLDDLLDPDRNLTFASLLQSALRDAGRTPQKLAAGLRTRGLRIGGRLYRPHEWPGLPPDQVSRALERAVVRYLDPALQEVASGFHLLHPALRARLKVAAETWVSRSQPYVELKSHPESTPRRHIFLYCFPAHRRTWEEEVLGNTTLVPVDPKAYGTDHPFVAVLLQADLGVAPGYLEGLPRYLQKINELKRTRKFPVLFDPKRFPRLWRLKERPESYEAAKALFQAGVDAGAINRITAQGQTPERFVLANSSGALHDLFAPPTLVAAWKTAAFFHQFLHQEPFVRFVEVNLQKPGFRRTAEFLKHEHDGESVAGQLVQAGILEAATGAAGQYRIQGLPPTMPYPEELYDRQHGLLVGLTRQEFVAQVQGNDELYEVVMEDVMDAFDQQRVSHNTLPPFLREYAAKR